MHISADTCERLALLASSALIVAVTGPAVILMAGCGVMVRRKNN